MADIPEYIDPVRHYRIVTSDWGVKNSARYFGEPAIVWKELPDLRLKAAVLRTLVE